jgi:hypothetical protein
MATRTAARPAPTTTSSPAPWRGADVFGSSGCDRLLEGVLGALVTELQQIDARKQGPPPRTSSLPSVELLNAWSRRAARVGKVRE